MITTRYFHPSLDPDENDTVKRFVSTLIWNEDRPFPPFASMAVMEDGKLIAGTIYHNWDQEAGVIEISSASTSRRWLTRPVIKAMFSLPFDGLGCQMSVLRVSERNEQMLRIARSFGFDEVFIPRLRGRDEGEFILTLTDEQWRSSPFNPDKSIEQV